MMEYLKKRQKRGSTQLAEPPAQSTDDDDQPVLTEEDELFLRRITSEPEGTPPDLPPRPQDLPVTGETSRNAGQMVLYESADESPLASPSRGGDAQAAIMDGANRVPLPTSPGPEDEGSGQLSGDGADGKSKGKGKGKEKEKKDRWAFLRRGSATKRKLAAADLQSAADGLRSPTSPQGEPQDEEEREKQELANIMEQLNLAAVNNRVFSMSTESRDLLRKFNLVLQDLVHGVPTAYQDLESLLTNSEGQLQKLYLALPAFLQQLVAKLPHKMSAHLGPEFLAAAAEKPSLKSAMAGGSNVKLRVPSVKELIAKRGAVAGLLRAIMDFLRTRFPAVLGLNVLWSVALFVLLLVFWYCHKRGKEVRLEKERALTEAEMEELRREVAADPPADYVQPTTTTAPEGASMEEVRLGAEEARLAHAAADDEGLESSRYAENGSLAQALRKDERTSENEEAQAGKKVERQVEGGEPGASHRHSRGSNDMGTSRTTAARKRDLDGAADVDLGEGTIDLTEQDKRRARRRAEAPSNQPRDKQESCRVM